MQVHYRIHWYVSLNDITTNLHTNLLVPLISTYSNASMPACNNANNLPVVMLQPACRRLKFFLQQCLKPEVCSHGAETTKSVAMGLKP